jgi:hypothetical protein
VDVLRDKRLAQDLHDRHGPADGRLEAQLDARFGRDGEEIRTFAGYELLVGGDDRLAGVQEVADVAAGRLDPAHHLGDDVDARVVAQRGEVVCEHALARREAAFLRRIAHERAHDGQPVPGRALDLIPALGEDPRDGRADRAVAEEPYADVNGRHAVSSTLSAI